MEFQLMAPGASELQFSQSLPSSFNGYVLPAPEVVEAKSAFGNMVFQQYKGDGFSIWSSNYNILHPTQLIGRGDIPVLELHMQFRNEFTTEWDGVGEKKVRCYQYNLTHTPFIFNRASFAGGREYHTFDIHFTLPFLENWAPHFPILDKFLEMVHKKQPTTIFDIDHLLSGYMIDTVNHIFHTPYTGYVLEFHIKSKVEELLRAVLYEASNLHPLGPVRINSYEIDKLYEARELVVKDFDNPLTIMQLARKVGMNDNKLKRGFKHLFGQTIFKYMQSVRMEQAHRSILETDHSIESISYLAGYEHVSNFNKAFQKHFGYTPAYLRRNKKV